MAEAWVASEKVGEGGPGEVERFGDSARLRSKRFLLGMTVAARQTDVGSGGLYSSLFGSAARAQFLVVLS